MLGGELVFGVLEPGEAGAQLAHQLAIAAFQEYIAFETIKFPPLLLTDNLLSSVTESLVFDGLGGLD